jgi:hypothetical protein
MGKGSYRDTEACLGLRYLVSYLRYVRHWASSDCERRESLFGETRIGVVCLVLYSLGNDRRGNMFRIY